MMFAPGCRKMISENARFAVHKTRGAHVLNRILHVGDIRQPHRRAVVIADDERLVVRGLEQLVVGENIGGACAIGELPLRQIGVLPAQQRRTSSRPRPKLFRCVGFDIHPHAGSELPPTNTWPTP